MKFNNDNSKEQMAYVAPKAKVFQVHIKNSLLEGSFGDANEAGDIMQETSENTMLW